MRNDRCLVRVQSFAMIFAALTSTVWWMVVMQVEAVNQQGQAGNAAGLPSSSAQWLVADTEYGPVRGHLQQGTTSGSRSFYAYKTIPYAKPPTGERRFKPPEVPDRWTDIRDMDQRTLCPQTMPYTFTDNQVYGTEDCLYLDIYTPQAAVQQQRYLPVMVYFHGGYFQHGGKDFYRPTYLMDTDVIVVIVNYRLGILGFLCTEDDEAPGNIGLRDQAMALRFVKGNIRNFYGNQGNITIFGHDAGGVSVSLHLVSPSSSGMFTAAISSSGTAFVPWAMTQQPLEHALMLARNFSCSTRSTWAVVSCLQRLNFTTLVNFQNTYQNLTFRPVVEDFVLNRYQKFLPDDPQKLYQDRLVANVPYISGVTRNEASLEVYGKIQEARMLTSPEKVIGFYLRPYFPPGEAFQSIVMYAKYHYFRNNKTTDFNTVTEILSDALYKGGNDLAVKLHSTINSHTYMYVFQHQGQRSLAYLQQPMTDSERNKYGVAHLDDAFYLFDIGYVSTPAPDYNDKQMITRMTQLWAGFAKDGDPTQSNYWGIPRWDPVNGGLAKDGQRYYNLSRSPTVGTGYRAEEMDFWNVFVPDLFRVSMLFSTPLPDKFTDRAKLQAAAWGMAGLVIVLGIACVALVGLILANRRRASHSLKLVKLTKSDSESQEKL